MSSFVSDLPDDARLMEFMGRYITILGAITFLALGVVCFKGYSETVVIQPVDKYRIKQPKSEEAIKIMNYMKARAQMNKKLYAFNDDKKR